MYAQSLTTSLDYPSLLKGRNKKSKHVSKGISVEVDPSFLSIFFQTVQASSKAYGQECITI
jgi:hypothetical protein